MAAVKGKLNVLAWAGLAISVIGVTWFLIYQYRENKKAEEGLELDENEKPPLACNDNFPLKKGSCGNRVYNIQIMLDVPATGNFDKDTQTALFEETGVKQVSESMYKYYENWLASLGLTV